MAIITNQEGMYEIKVNVGKKEIDLRVSGIFTAEKAQQFVAEYKNKVEVIEAAKYDLVLDCHGIAISKPEMVPVLQSCFEMYKESGFKEIRFLISKNPTIKMQFNRLIRNVGLTNTLIIED